MLSLSRAQKSFVYDSAKRAPRPLEELQAVFQYRDLIYQLIRRDIVARYKRSVLGIGWTMLHPLGMMLILSFVFSQVFHRTQGYPAYILSGLMAWTFFSQTTTAAMNQLIWGGVLLHRIYLPRTAFAISAIGTGLVNLVLGLIPLVIVTLLVGVPIHWTILLAPIAMLLLAAFALGVGLLLSAWAIYFPDIAEMYQVALLAWMYLTPIIYPPELVPETYRFWLFHLNPMYYFVKLFRLCVYEGALPSWPLLIAATGIAFSTLTLGWMFFTQKADEFAYHT